MDATDDDWYGAACASRTAGDVAAADAMEQAALERVYLDGAICCWVQPLVRLSDEKVCGYEALARFRGSCLSLGPEDWLEVASRHGQRERLELAMLRAAAALGPPPDGVRLFVNASASTLLHPEFEAVRVTLPEHVIEITEHDPVRDYGELLPRLTAFRAQGSLIAVDDVGSGYASMAHVLELDPAYLKIDRSIVSGLDQDPRRRALVAALHTLAAESGAHSVAEGVERPAELAVLRDVGVDFVQGFLVCRPGPAWPRVSPGNGSPAGSVEGRFRRRIAAAPDCRSAANLVTSDLARDSALLPSIYLVRGSRLRCIARFGQWLVMDGIPAGCGLTGTAWIDGQTILVNNVASDARYRQAVPDVCSEIAVPLRVDGQVVGVLNVDALRPLTDADVSHINSSAAALERRLTTVGCGPDADSILQRLGRTAAQLAGATSAQRLAEIVTTSATRFTGLDSASLWLTEDAGFTLAASCGPDASTLATLDHDSLTGLRHLVQDMTSCYTTGPALDLGSGPTETLRSAGVQAAVLVPMRDDGELTGFLLLTRQHGAVTPPDAVEIAELICQHAGSRHSALRRMQELENLATRDILSGLANRARLDILLADSSTAERARWVAAIDIDRFKHINDTFGHAVGDDVLRALGAVLNAVPGRFEALRLGGDEFVVLLKPGSESTALAVCQQLHHSAVNILNPFGAGLSMGLASTDQPGGLETALIQADKALYESKNTPGVDITIWRHAAPPRQIPKQLTFETGYPSLEHRLSNPH